jgi:hypothetical protein
MNLHSLSYSNRTFHQAVDRIKQLYYAGKSNAEISNEVSLSEIIVEGILERYVHARQED